MSSVTAKINTPTPKPVVTKPREVRFDGVRYKVEGENILASGSFDSWFPSTFNDVPAASLPKPILELLLNPTKTVSAPAEEPTVTLTMSLDKARRLRYRLGELSGLAGSETYTVFDKLNDAFMLAGVTK